MCEVSMKKNLEKRPCGEIKNVVEINSLLWAQSF